MKRTFAFARHLQSLADGGLPDDWRQLAANLLGVCQAIRGEDETDAQRAGEPLRAFCYPLVNRDGSTVWLLRIFGCESGEEYAELGFVSDEADAAEWPLELLGPAMELALNGDDDVELSASFRELVEIAAAYEG